MALAQEIVETPTPVARVETADNLADAKNVIVNNRESTNGESTSTFASANPQPQIRTLSTVGRMYDVDGDGELDEAELQMRNMDMSGRGYLTNDKVYKMMQTQIETQAQLFRSKRISCLLLALVIVLALCQLGTSLAAVHLAKDTSPNVNEQLTHKSNGESNGEVLSTQSTDESFEIQRMTIDADGRRHLCTKQYDEDGDLIDCEVESFLQMKKRDCRRMVKNCQRGNNVSARRTWPNGEESSFSICPHTGGGRLREFSESRFTNSDGKHFYFDQDEEEDCVLRGNAVTQDEGETCVVTADCDVDAELDLRCEKLDSVVESCKAVCMRRRYVKRRQDACLLACDYPSCQRMAVVERER